MTLPQDLHNLIKKDVCTKCGGPAEGWKCAQCGKSADGYDPMHKCGGGKIQPKCKACDQAEDNCKCFSHS